ncbi:alpha-amylase [Streptomyces sp. NPDC086989]|uniref:alpha-amylase n=1 Tax=Streptomyces sp. NPDC086989 TaxID=3365764 RepID=UPI0038018519
MTNLRTRLARHAVLTLLLATVWLPAALPAVAASGPQAPACADYHESWRYTDVHNGCGDAVALTVTYVNGQEAPCRLIDPGGWATFAGYGTNGNHVTGLQTCEPAPATALGPASLADHPARP